MQQQEGRDDKLPVSDLLAFVKAAAVIDVREPALLTEMVRQWPETLQQQQQKIEEEQMQPAFIAFEPTGRRAAVEALNDAARVAFIGFVITFFDGIPAAMWLFLSAFFFIISTVCLL